MATVPIQIRPPRDGATADEWEQGQRQTQKMSLPDRNQPGALNQEMAQAAATQFKKREKKIQKACAKLDQPEQKQGCACVIL